MGKVNRAVLLGWVITLAALGLVVGIIGLLGGWRLAEADIGQRLPQERPIELTRWRVEVLGAELVNRDPSGATTSDRIVVSLTATNTTDATLLDVGEVVTAIPARLGDPAPEVLRNYALPGSYDPDIPRAATVTLKYEEGVVAPPPGTVTVVIRDEHESAGFLSDASSFSVGAPVGHVLVDCPDRRVRG